MFYSSLLHNHSYCLVSPQVLSHTLPASTSTKLNRKVHEDDSILIPSCSQPEKYLHLQLSSSCLHPIKTGQNSNNTPKRTIKPATTTKIGKSIHKNKNHINVQNCQQNGVYGVVGGGEFWCYTKWEKARKKRGRRKMKGKSAF